jgi:predicted AAA+ superfamily ATPase
MRLRFGTPLRPILGLFVRHDGLMVIDEVQRVPDLFLAIKHEVDIDPRPVRFLITGSARLVGRRDIYDLVPGRSERVELSPLSQGEIDQRPDSFIDAAFHDGVEVGVPPPDLRRDNYVERALRGGYPGAVRRSDPGRRGRFFDSNISACPMGPPSPSRRSPAGRNSNPPMDRGGGLMFTAVGLRERWFRSGGICLRD